MADNQVFRSEDIPFADVAWGRTKFMIGADPAQSGVVSTLVQVNLTEYAPGYSHEGHRHPGQIEVIVILSGQGEHEREDGSRQQIGPGDVIYVPEGSYHGNHNPHEEPLRAIIIKVPPTGSRP